MWNLNLKKKQVSSQQPIHTHTIVSRLQNFQFGQCAAGQDHQEEPRAASMETCTTCRNWPIKGFQSHSDHMRSWKVLHWDIFHVKTPSLKAAGGVHCQATMDCYTLHVVRLKQLPAAALSYLRKQSHSITLLEVRLLEPVVIHLSSAPPSLSLTLLPPLVLNASCRSEKSFVPGLLQFKHHYEKQMPLIMPATPGRNELRRWATTLWARCWAEPTAPPPYHCLLFCMCVTALILFSSRHLML